MASLYLIDGHNVLYRTFFGVPRLTAPDGTPTNVVLGVARILLKILREERPDAVVAVFDSREPTPRHAIYPEYKANRLKTPEDLSSQIPVVDEMIDALGVRRLSIAAPRRTTSSAPCRASRRSGGWTWSSSPPTRTCTSSYQSA
ncbi:MAG: hypothetical protein IH610_06015 [Deltaproteobacteria bacterium]|nr:hypothetical protein [Deltaproteobacteria bacterium]